jgi:hypothetical protein
MTLLYTPLLGLLFSSATGAALMRNDQVALFAAAGVGSATTTSLSSLRFFNDAEPALGVRAPRPDRLVRPG